MKTEHEEELKNKSNEHLEEVTKLMKEIEDLKAAAIEAEKAKAGDEE